MTKNKKMASSKKIVIAVALASLFVIGAIITVVAVLASQVQNISSNISVTYIVDGVGAKVSAKYAKVPSTGEITKVSMEGENSVQEHEFLVSDDSYTNGEKQLNGGDVKLTSSTKKVVYEYKFTNTAESAFTVALSEVVTKNNMKVRYQVSATEILADDYRVELTDDSYLTQLIVEQDKTIYVYMSIEVDNLNMGASYNGNIVWVLNYVPESELITINLDNGDDFENTTTKAKAGVALPVIFNMPEDVAGYCSEANGVGTQYVKANGVGTKACNLNDGDTLYAKFKMFILRDNGDGSKILTKLNNATGTVIIPENVTAIADGAGEGSSLSTLIISNEVESIGDEAFKNCISLETVIIGIDSNASAVGDVKLSHIGSNAFAGCDNISSVTYNGKNISDWNAIAEDVLFDDHTTSIAKALITTNYPSVTFSDAGELSSCSSLSGDIVLPYGVKSIGNNAFSRCINLTSITIPNSVTSIKNYVFSSCINLTSIAIGSSVTGIGNQSFSTCCKLVEIYNHSNLNITLGSSDYGYIAYYAKIVRTDNGASYITESDGIKYLEYNGEVVCLGSIDKTIEKATIKSTCTEINLFAFEGCSCLTSIEIPNNVTSIRRSAFDGCSSLTNIEIPNNVTSIESSAFGGCSSLTSIEIPSSVTSIENYAFINCSSLTSITFEDPNGWYRTTNQADWQNKQNGVSVNLSNASTNVNYFTLYSYPIDFTSLYWYKV